MGMSYKRLWKLLIDRNMNKGDLIKVSGISTSSVAKLAKGENVQTDVLVKLCCTLDCDVSDIVEYERQDIDRDVFAPRQKK